MGWAQRGAVIFPETHSLQGSQSSAPSMVPYWISESSIQGRRRSLQLSAMVRAWLLLWLPISSTTCPGVM